MIIDFSIFSFFFFNDTATTEIYTLSLHDALPISMMRAQLKAHKLSSCFHPSNKLDLPDYESGLRAAFFLHSGRSEEHTSELQSLAYLVCRLLLEKKKRIYPELASSEIEVLV